MIYLLSESVAFLSHYNYTQIHLIIVTLYLIWHRRNVPFVLSKTAYGLFFFFAIHLVYSVFCAFFDRGQNISEALVYGIYPILIIFVLSNLRRVHLEGMLFYLVLGDIVVGYLVPEGQRSSAGFSLGLLLLDVRYILPFLVIGFYPIFVNNMRSTFVFYFVQIIAQVSKLGSYVRFVSLLLFVIISFKLSTFILSNPAVARLSSTLFSEEFKVDSNKDGGRIGEVYQAWDAFSKSENYLRFVVGAGTGFQYFDLKTLSQRSHLHVTPAAIFFRYGFVGLIMFLLWWVQQFRKSNISNYLKFTLLLIFISSLFSGSLMIIQNVIYVKYVISQANPLRS